MYKYLTFLLFCLLTHIEVSAQYKLKGVVKDESGAFISEARISIGGKNVYSKTNSNGEFTYELDNKPEMPIKIFVIRLGYELKEVNFSEGEKFLEVIVKKAPIPTPDHVEVIQLVSDSAVSFEKLTIIIGDDTYSVEKTGTVSLKKAVRDTVELNIPNYQIKSKSFNNKKKLLTINIIPSLLAEEVLVSLTDSVVDKKNFESLFNQFEVEKKIIAESNHKIENEMNAILRQLEADSVTPARRQELTNYLLHLEKLYEANKSALEKDIEKKYSILFKMKAIIIQKDSINMLSQKQLSEYKIKQKTIEADYRGKMTYLSVIILLILIILGVVIVNIRKLKKQGFIIEEQNRSLEAFAYKASHEIKGPLNSMKGLADLALSSVKDAETLEYFGYMQKTIQKLTNTINNILYFSKAKNIIPKYKSIKLKNYTDEIIKGLMFKENFDNIKIRNKIPETSLISSDEIILESVLQNLIGNAIKYQDFKKTDPYLDINFEEKNGFITLQFVDNGIGIDSIHKDKLFGMFYRATNKAEGTGLGLYIIKLSLEKLGGSINFESKFGEYTKFTVSIPNRKNT